MKETTVKVSFTAAMRQSRTAPICYATMKMVSVSYGMLNTTLMIGMMRRKDNYLTPFLVVSLIAALLLVIQVGQLIGNLR
jgi:hypothetical protein